MANTNRAVAFIDLSILEENYKTIKAKVLPETGILCVVKADAYGHGAVEVCRRIESIGISYLGVATIDEAVDLRANGINSPILVMSGIMPWDDISVFLQQDVTPVVYELSVLMKLSSLAKSFSKPLKIHLKFDTGMGRLGFMPDDASLVINHLAGVDNIHVEGLMSHFSSSEIRDAHGIGQINTFKKIIEVFLKKGFQLEIVHMANSGAIINYPESHFNMVRTEFPEGFPLSYGRTFVTSKSTRVAYIPVGYADGYPRALSNKGSVLIRDKRCDVIGRVCMDWFLVDVTGYGDINVNDEVILLGESITDCITADEIAEISGTIPYEILCKISKRVIRIFK
jgi:alanine racemase